MIFAHVRHLIVASSLTAAAITGNAQSQTGFEGYWTGVSPDAVTTEVRIVDITADSRVFGIQCRVGKGPILVWDLHPDGHISAWYEHGQVSFLTSEELWSLTLEPAKPDELLATVIRRGRTLAFPFARFLSLHASRAYRYGVPGCGHYPRKIDRTSRTGGIDSAVAS